MSQVRAQSRFLWTLLVLQVVFAVLYLLLVRYNPSADAKNVENQLHGGKNSEELEKNLRKYPSRCTACVRQHSPVHWRCRSLCHCQATWKWDDSTNTCQPNKPDRFFWPQTGNSAGVNGQKWQNRAPAMRDELVHQLRGKLTLLPFFTLCF